MARLLLLLGFSTGKIFIATFRHKSVFQIPLISLSAIALPPIRVHQRASAVQKSDRPYVKKSDRPFPHPRPSVCICGSKERSTGASKRAIDLSPIRVHQRVSAVQKCDLPFV